MSAVRTVDAKFYAQVKASFGKRYDSNVGSQVPMVRDAKVVSITQQRVPAKAGCIVVELTLRFPEAAFLPMQPAAVITIPDNFVGMDMVEVEALDPTDMNEVQVAEYLAQQGRSQS